LNCAESPLFSFLKVVAATVYRWDKQTDSGV